MPAVRTVAVSTLTDLQRIDSCTVSNAIEHFRVRTRNEGFVSGSPRCMIPELPPVIGYAVTAKVRTSSTPMAGRCYYDHIDWWTYVHSAPGPQFVVIEDVDPAPGLGALFGDIHANIARALGCVAYLTNGAIRDLPGSAAIGFQMFAGGVSVSHAYAHIVDYGKPVTIGGLTIAPGNLLHGDRHGVVSVPLEIAEQVPGVAKKIAEAERSLVGFCQSPDFSFDGLAARLREASEKSGVPDRDPR